MNKLKKTFEKADWIPRHLNAKNKGKFSYDFANDLLYFGIKDEEYENSIRFENFIIDFNSENFIIGIRIFDASKIFGVLKVALRSINAFEFNAMVEEGTISIQLKVAYVFRNHEISNVNFVRDASNTSLPDSQALISASA